MIHELMPSDTPEYMLPAWFSCINWAIGEPDVVAAFRAETGNKWEPATDPISQMVDKATGVDWAFIRDFVLWANVNIWGPLDGDENETSADTD